MKILFYSVKPYEHEYLFHANFQKLEIVFTDKALEANTVNLANGFDGICLFTSDDASKEILIALKNIGIQHIVLRSAGYDHIDLQTAKELRITVANVPKYSPYAIAEHAVALILALNRKLIIANQQVLNNNFTTDSLIGFDLHGKTVGIIGLGKIGSIFAKIMNGFGCELLGYDIVQNNTLVHNYALKNVPLDELIVKSDIISIHTNLSPSTKYIINKKNIANMKNEVMIINTSRGACVNTEDIIDALTNNRIGSYGADVYEHEKGIFFYDYTNKSFHDELLKKLIHCNNVIITPHQAFATHEALSNIASSTFYSLHCWQNSVKSECEIEASV